MELIIWQKEYRRKTEAVKEPEKTEGAEDVVQHEKQDEVDNMKRQLTEEEKEKTEKGMTRLAKEITDLKENIEFNEKTIAFQKAQEDYNEFARPYLQKQKEAKDEKTMSYMRMDLMSKQDTLKGLHSHIKDGVEIKNQEGD